MNTNQILEEKLLTFINEKVKASVGQKKSNKSKINIKFIKFFLMCKGQGFTPNSTCLAFSSGKDYQKINQIKETIKIENSLEYIFTNWTKYKVLFENKQYSLIKKSKA